MNMPYTNEPRWAAISLSVLRMAQYALVFVGGVVTAFYPPPTLSALWGWPVLEGFSIVMALCAIPAFYGVLRKLYQYEWIPCWVIAGAVGGYAAAAWGRTTINELDRVLSVSNLTIAAICFLMRAINLTIVAQKNRNAQRLLR